VDTDLTAAQKAAGWGSVHRVRKNAKGDWVRDAKFSFGPFDLNGNGNPWSARYLAVGADGTLYTTVNAYVYAIDTAGRIRADQYGQYDANGVRIGAPIGGYDWGAPTDGYNVVEGIAASFDGAYLYITEEDYDYVTRYVRGANGLWTPDKVAGTPHHATDTCTDAGLAAPYDVAVTSAGSVVVANTTCGELRRYSSDLVQQETVLRIYDCNLCFKPHGIAMASGGAFVLPWRNEVYARS
jgi:hypothetical protein